MWLELLNEPGREPAQARWVGRLMTGMARLALNAGLSGMGRGAGQPGDRGVGHDRVARVPGAVRGVPRPGGCPLHEYSLDRDNIMAGEAKDGSRRLVGRYEHLHAAVDKAGIARPNIYITECAGRSTTCPPQSRPRPTSGGWRRVRASCQRQGGVSWTLQSGDGNGKPPQRLNALMPWLTDYTINPQPPLVEEPIRRPASNPPPAERLANGSFEGDGITPTTCPNYRYRSAGRSKWRSGDDPGWANPADPSPVARFVREVRTLPVEQLPEAGASDLRPRRPPYGQGLQGGGARTSPDADRGRVEARAHYRLVTPVYPDVVMRYEDGQKVWPMTAAPVCGACASGRPWWAAAAARQRSAAAGGNSSPANGTCRWLTSPPRRDG